MKSLAAFFAAFIIIIVILADVNELPDFIRHTYNIPNGDKVGHFILFGILNFLLTRTALTSLHGRAPERVALTTSLVLVLLIGLEEFSQRLFSARTSDWFDFLASCLEVTVGTLLAYKKNREGQLLFPIL